MQVVNLTKFILETLGKAIFIYTTWYGFSALAWMMLQ